MDALIATLFVFRHKLHVYHLHVTGPMFLQLHKMFQKQYEDILEYADRLAEHVLSRRDHFSPSLHDMLKHSSITDVVGIPENAMKICQIVDIDVIAIIGMIDRIEPAYPALDTILGDLQAWLYKQKYIIESIMT